MVCLPEQSLIYNINLAIKHTIKLWKTVEANTNHTRLALEIRTLNLNLESLIINHYQSITLLRDEYESLHARRV